MNFNQPHFIQSDGFEIATYSDGALDGTPLILVHGWPEIAYSWKPIVPILVQAGYRVICYDLRGFGRSSAPLDSQHYAMPQLVADLESVMDGYGLSQSLICGHDWGGSIVWHAARMIRHRVTGVVGICVPHTARAPAPPLKIIEKRAGRKHYFLEFLYKRAETAALFAKDPDGFFRLMFRSTPEGAVADETFTFIPTKFAEFLAAGSPPLKGGVMDQADRAVFVEAYTRTGYETGMNLYQNINENWKLAEGMSDRIDQPVLMISPERDLLLPPELADPMEHMVDDLTRVTIPNCGHWAMWDAPDAISRAMLDWLSLRS
ncbi:alpha/beta fold hydrolase [Litorimonas sp. RW-G-Af-16]|uniref:alpha/beta fold hydrolase n=1 Tax=Litorimonas sp. RW-G-Af-16 TaxID=3241168 RepID=UPI003AB0632C